MTSSTSSLRGCRLGEITEDAEENAGDKGDYKPHNYNWRDSIYSRTSDVTAVPPERDIDAISPSHNTQHPSSEMPDKTSDKPLPSVPRDHGPYQPNGITHKRSVDQISYAGTEPRNSSQSSRPSFRDLDQSSLYRQKIKLGPRPSLDSTGRPRTAGSLVGKSQESRRVAALPAGVRYSSRKTPVPRPKSQTDLQLAAFPRPPKVPPLPALLVPPPPINLGPMSRNGSSSPRSVMSMPAMGMSPEKQRLMRALELRKEQMKKRTGGAEKRKKEEEASKSQDKVKPALPEASELPSLAESEDIKLENSSPTQQVQHSSEPSPKAPECLPDKAKENEKTVAAGLSKPDSAVDMADGDSVGDVPDEASERKNNAENQSPPILKASESSSAHIRDNGEDSKLDDQQSCQPVELDESEIQNVPKETAQELPLADIGNEGQLRITEIETNEDFLDSATPTPRAIPITASHEDEAAEPPVLPVDQDSRPTQMQTYEADVEQASTSHASQPMDEDEAAEPPILPVDQDSRPTQTQTCQVDAEQASTSHVSQSMDKDVSAAEPPPLDPKEASVPTAVETENKLPSSSENTNTDLNRTTSIKERRAGVPHPIQIPTTAEFSDEENLLSNDSFMEELKSASVQEANSISLPKSGVSDENGSPGEIWAGSRAVSNPAAAGSDLQALPVGRSASGTYFENHKPVPVMVARKVNVSSGISKRIKALEMFTGKEPPTNPQPPAAPTPPPASRSSSPFENFRKRSSFSQTNLPSAATLKSKPSTEHDSRVASPTPQRQASLAVNSQNRAKSSSVSVTAKIIRNQSAPSQQPIDLSEPTALDLHQSELTVEQDGQDENLRSRTASPAKVDNRRLSVSSNAQSPRANLGQVPLSDSISSRLSISSFSRFERSLSYSSSEQTVEDVKDEKKESRKSRIIRRMSSITSNSRRGLKNTLSPTVKEEVIPTPVAPPEPKIEQIAPEPPQAIDIGEVNVQFPDTLLWKRRFMRVDSQGYLVLTHGTVDRTARNIVKRYHFSEFRTPCLPDQDRQELANSIVLDFFDGGTLQCACESRQGQHAVLQGQYHSFSIFLDKC